MWAKWPCVLVAASTLPRRRAWSPVCCGYVAVPWKDDAKLEALIKERTGATLRCVPLATGNFTALGKDGERLALFARAY